MISLDPLGVAEKTAVAEEIISSVRHDLRNRYATIRNAAFYIKRKVLREQVCRDDPRIEEFLSIIDEEVELASALVDNSVRCKLRVRREVVLTSAVGCLRKVAECARIENPSIQVELDAVDAEIEVDPIELSLAVRCLVENAAEAMASGGVITVRGSVELGRYRIEVSDTGAGLPSSANDEIMSPFYTTKPGHSGLGLNIAWRVVRRYQGLLSLDRRDNGTSVVIELPIVNPVEIGDQTAGESLL